MREAEGLSNHWPNCWLAEIFPLLIFCSPCFFAGCLLRAAELGVSEKKNAFKSRAQTALPGFQLKAGGAPVRPGP